MIQTAVLNYFRNTKNYSTIRFILEMAVLAFVLKIIFTIGAIALGVAVNLGYQNDIQNELLSDRFLPYVIVLIVPVIETLLLGLTIFIISRFTKNLYYQIFIAAIVFAVMHREPILMIAMFPIGAIFSWSYKLNRRISLWRAIWVTSSIHALLNLSAILLKNAF
ncbi:MAG: hypothetical protein KW802_03390 [Candidatus Doudnabacteria bacterium]|nr:hypothetical protein [Candidatus Doudnabacteria bacterium]